MKYQVDATEKSDAAIYQWLQEYGEVERREFDWKHRFFCTVSQDDFNIPLMQEMLTAIREGQVLRCTIWEPL